MKKGSLVVLFLWFLAGCSGRTQRFLCPRHIETPTYSALAKTAHVSGTVVLTLTIDANLRGHPKPANEGHLKTGQRVKPGTLTLARGLIASVSMSNVLSEEKKQQVIALGKLGWPLAAHRASHWCPSRNSRRLPEGGRDCSATTGCLGTASAGKTGQRGDHRPGSLQNRPRGDHRLRPAVFNRSRPDHPRPSASACEPYRELIEQGLSRGRNAMAIWQDLVSDHGFPAATKR